MWIVLLELMERTMQDEIKPIFLLEYDWSVLDGDLILDSQLRTDSFGWRIGDHFQLKILNGKQALVKVDPIELFIDGVNVNGA